MVPMVEVQDEEEGKEPGAAPTEARSVGVRRLKSPAKYPLCAWNCPRHVPCSVSMRTELAMTSLLPIVLGSEVFIVLQVSGRSTGVVPRPGAEYPPPGCGKPRGEGRDTLGTRGDDLHRELHPLGQGQLA